jgi:hypothetical protein
MRVKIPLIGPSYKNRELPLSAQVTKNLFPEINPESKSITSLHTFPGLKEFASLSGIDRGLHVMSGVLFAVKGTTLSSVNSSGTDTTIGTISGNTRCGFADNGSQLVVVNGSTPSLYETTLESITDTDVVNPTVVAYLNAQFILDQNDGTDGEFITSQLVTTLTAADFAATADKAEAESHPDDILAVVSYNQQVYFFGSETVEPWWNSGVGSPPFDRVQGAVRPFGIAGKDAIAIADDSIFFLDNERVPQELIGLQVKPIGNIPLGVEWAGYSDVSDCIVLTFILDNQRFALYTFPTTDRSWMFHEPSGSWAQLSYGVDDARTRISSYAYVYGKHIVGDHTNGKLYELDFSTFTDNSNVIQRQRSTATIHGGLYGFPGAELFFDRVDFDVQTGEGLTTGQGSDPQLMVRYSDDRGRTWSAENWYPLGEGGDYLKRVSLYQQGSSFERIYELTYSDPTKFAMFEAWADISFSQ